jgi:hypothetical protein
MSTVKRHIICATASYAAHHTVQIDCIQLRNIDPKKAVLSELQACNCFCARRRLRMTTRCYRLSLDLTALYAAKVLEDLFLCGRRVVMCSKRLLCRGCNTINMWLEPSCLRNLGPGLKWELNRSDLFGKPEAPCMFTEVNLGILDKRQFGPTNLW